LFCWKNSRDDEGKAKEEKQKNNKKKEKVVLRIIVRGAYRMFASRKQLNMWGLTLCSLAWL